MNPSGSGSTFTPRQISSIRQASEEMGVSERTIYRQLRSGKLIRSKSRVISVNNDTDNTCQNDLNEINNSDKNVSNMSKSSDRMTFMEMELLRASIREKDTKIEQLLENQREMNQTLQRLQEQMFELARLVLSQNALTSTRATEPAVSAEREKNTDWRRWLSFFKPAADKKSDE